jgi:hypothetical protein
VVRRLRNIRIKRLVPWLVFGLFLSVVFTATASGVTMPPEISVDELQHGAPTAEELAPPECQGMSFDGWIVIGDPDPGGTLLVIGSGADDYFDRSSSNDETCIIGGDGDDELYGGRRDDIILAGDGNDTVYGGNGRDVIYGGDGVDWLLGENGNDEIYGEEGFDFIFGGNGNDYCDGGGGWNWISGCE